MPSPARRRTDRCERQGFRPCRRGISAPGTRRYRDVLPVRRKPRQHQMHDIVGKVVLAIGDENFGRTQRPILCRLGPRLQRADIRARLRLGPPWCPSTRPRRAFPDSLFQCRRRVLQRSTAPIVSVGLMAAHGAGIPHPSAATASMVGSPCPPNFPAPTARSSCLASGDRAFSRAPSSPLRPPASRQAVAGGERRDFRRRNARLTGSRRRSSLSPGKALPALASARRHASA